MDFEVVFLLNGKEVARYRCRLKRRSIFRPTWAMRLRRSVPITRGRPAWRWRPCADPKSWTMISKQLASNSPSRPRKLKSADLP